MQRLFSLFILLFFSAGAVAQSSTVPVYKEYQQTLFQLTPRLDVVLKQSKVNAYLEGVYNTNALYASITEQTRWNIKPGIDIGLTSKWFAGVSERINVNGAGIYNYTTRLYVQHRGELFGLLFSKEFLYEQFNYTEGTLNTTTSSGTTATRRPMIGRVGIGLGLGKYIPVEKNHLAVFMSYKPFVQFDFVKDGVSFFKERFIDYTNLRIDAGYLIDNAYYVGVYASRETNYLYVPAAEPYNSNGITPVFGVACNFLLFVDPAQEKELSSFRYFYTK